MKYYSQCHSSSFCKTGTPAHKCIKQCALSPPFSFKQSKRKLTNFPASDEYLEDSNFLPEDKIREIISQFLETTAANGKILCHSLPRYYKTYFFTSQNHEFSQDKNRLEIYLYYDECWDEYRHQRIYIPLVFRNLVLHIDGTINIEYDHGYNSTIYTDCDSITVRDGYDVEEIYIEF